MKILIIAFTIILTAFSVCSAKQPYDSQRVLDLLDCQTYFIDKIEGAHDEKVVTVCFYEVTYYRKGEVKKTILRVQSGDLGEISFEESR
jgi:hypothetical protein